MSILDGQRNYGNKRFAANPEADAARRRLLKESQQLQAQLMEQSEEIEKQRKVGEDRKLRRRNSRAAVRRNSMSAKTYPRLTVSVLRVSNLMKTPPRNENVDSYVKCLIGDQNFQTTTRKGTLSPVWKDATHTFDVPPLTVILRVEVWAAEAGDGKMDELLAVADVPLFTAADVGKKAREEIFELKSAANESSSANQPLQDSDTAAAAAAAKASKKKRRGSRRGSEELGDVGAGVGEQTKEGEEAEPAGAEAQRKVLSLGRIALTMKWARAEGEEDDWRNNRGSASSVESDGEQLARSLPVLPTAAPAEANGGVVDGSAVAGGAKNAIGALRRKTSSFGMFRRASSSFLGSVDEVVAAADDAAAQATAQALAEANGEAGSDQEQSSGGFRRPSLTRRPSLAGLQEMFARATGSKSELEAMENAAESAAKAEQGMKEKTRSQGEDETFDEWFARTCAENEAKKKAELDAMTPAQRRWQAVRRASRSSFELAKLTAGEIGGAAKAVGSAAMDVAEIAGDINEARKDRALERRLSQGNKR